MKRTLVRILQAVLPLVLLGLAGLAAVTMIRNRPVVETRPPEIAPPGVRVHVVALEDVALAVTSEGTVRPRTESELVPEVSGRVMSVAPSFAEGGFFEAGDVLVTVDPFDYEQAVVAARAQLAQSRLRLAEEEAEAEVAQREWDSLGQGDPRELTLRKPQLDDARAAVAAAEAGLVRAERDLERARITAPYAGRVRRKGVDVGQFVTMGSSVATIYAVDRAEIRLPLPDNELAYLNLPLAYRGGENRQGPGVTLRSTFAGETHAWNGRIVRTESEIDPVSRMVHVVAEVDDPYRPGPDPDRPPLAVGMYVDAEIEGRRFRQIAVVPRSGLRGRSQVMVVDGEGRLRFRDVELLRMTADSIYVRSGLANGERVVISTLDSPTDGMQVQVTNPGPDLLAERAPDGAAGASPAAGPAPPAPAPAPASPAGMPPAAPAAPGATPSPAGPPPAAPPAPARPPAPAGPPALAGPPAPAAPAAARAAQAPVPRPPLSQRPLRRVAAPPAPATEAPVQDARAVAVLPFTDISEQAADADLGATLAEGVSAEIGSIDTVTVAPAVTGANWVVGGAVEQLDDAVQVTARIVETRAGSIVRTVRVDGAASELARLQQATARAVARSLADALNLTAAAAGTPRAPAAGTPAGRAAPAPAMAAATVQVRPFANLSQAPADEMLAREVGEAVVAQLSRTGTFTVVGSEDAARWIVAGGIQRVGNLLRITARLVDAREGSVVRAVKVDGSIEELMRLQDEVALAMSSGVREAAGD